MERLTKWDGNHASHWDCQGSCENCNGCCGYCSTMVDRLAAIEDILGDEYDLDRLRELVQADREGRCVVLPAKVDETVYQAKKGDDCPCCFHLEGVNISEDGDITYPMYWGESFTPDDFGTKLFRTHDEAKAALRREQE